MTKLEKELACLCLRMASDQFSNHGCNDFPMDNTDEIWDLHEKIDDWAETEPEDRSTRPAGNKIYFYDWLLMNYLADMIEAEAEAE
jgi:hypothetical protein